MSASALPVAAIPARPRAAKARPTTLFSLVDSFVRGLASLKLTVGLMAYGILVVYVGTIAQKHADIWQVVHDYFHAWLMWVDINLFFPKEFFWFVPTLDIPAPGFLAAFNITNFHTIPLPGGLIVGTLMAVNLLAAHGWRFKMQSSGSRLAAGLVVLGVGLLIGVAIIITGHNVQGFQAKPPFRWDSFWTAFLMGGSLLWVGLATVLGVTAGRRLTRGATWIDAVIFSLLIVAMLGLAALLAWGLFGSVRPADEALRIVWQLLQGSLASVVLLVGCVLVFRKRGGIVLLHAGIGLLIFNELFVALTARERQVYLEEGQTTNYLRDIRTVEMAIVDRSAKEDDTHIVIPRSLLERNYEQNLRLEKAGKPPVPLADPRQQLPFDLAVVKFYRNSKIRKVASGERTLATAGHGLVETIDEQHVAKGTDSDGKVDIAGAFVRVTEKGTGKVLGTYMVSQFASLEKNPWRLSDQVSVGGKPYYLMLRFKQEYKPFTISLVEVRRDDYVASNTPRNYSSDIHLVDPAAGIDQTVHIKMNEPLRYRGDTFYQSGHHPPEETGAGEATTLQVVHNRAWMIPYVACMAVVIGMVAHFLISVTRFIARREDEERQSGLVITAEVVDDKSAADSRRRKGKPLPERPAIPARKFAWSLLILPGLTAFVFLYYVNTAARLPKPKKDEFDLYRFGQLPVAHLGRVKPIDSLARDTVRTIAGGGKESIKWQTKELRNGKMKEVTVKIPATQWLLEVAARTERSRQLRAFRIDSKEVRRLFELKDRPGFMYSAEELFPEITRFEDAVAAAVKTHRDDRTVEQRRILELDTALKAYVSIARSFGPPDLPRTPTREQIEANPDVVLAYRRELELTLAGMDQEFKNANAPRIIPLRLGKEQPDEDVWMAYPVAQGLAWMQQLKFYRDEPDPKTLAFASIIDAYRANDPKLFNEEVQKYQALVDRADAPLYQPSEVAKEAYFNFFSPFYVGMPLYVMGFLLAIFGWLFRYKPLNWAALTMILLTFLLHTVALWWRMDFSGRPPVTNLYSSAIFIGWGCVLFGLIIEAIYRLGLGNIVASIAGFATLLIAYLLNWSGEDNVGVMQAVLDTQFWLATHVVCITLGYASTYLAGLLGLMYVILGHCTPMLNERSRKELGRMIYGITCFAILFSFYGTVLGGLWADDSWGRFWGWDPKENGALIIVLWNALVLHARWDKMIADRGLAVMAIGGNIVTSWSWFGVNQLGVGLHSYGFTSGVAMALMGFGFSQLLFIALGCLPKTWWWSMQADGNRAEMQAA